jgi:hypothetical protein
MVAIENYENWKREYDCCCAPHFLTLYIDFVMKASTCINKKPLKNDKFPRDVCTAHLRRIDNYADTVSQACTMP